MICHASQNGLNNVCRSCGVDDCASGETVEIPGRVAGKEPLSGNTCPTTNPPEKPPSNSATPIRQNKTTFKIFATKSSISFLSWINHIMPGLKDDETCIESLYKDYKRFVKINSFIGISCTRRWNS